MFIFDIETVEDINPQFFEFKQNSLSAPSNYKDPLKIQQYIESSMEKLKENAPLDPMTGKIIMIGILMDKNYVGLDDKDFVKKTVDNDTVIQIYGEERKILETFWDIFQIYRLNCGDPIVSYNGKSFDLPFIIIRSAVNGIVLKDKMTLSDYINKYNYEKHIDLYTILNSHSLSEWAFLFNLTNQLSNDGKKIAEFYKMGSPGMELIKDKNLIDLMLTKNIYRKLYNIIK